MASDLKSSTSIEVDPEAQGDRRGTAPNGWWKVGAVAAASAVLGGLAAAWFYHKTLSQLRDAEDAMPNAESGVTGDDSPEDF